METKIERRKKPKFLRKDWHKCLRLGGAKKKKLKWRRARGRHSKLRQKWKSRQKMPSIGYGMPRAIRGLIEGMNPVMVNNKNDLEKVGERDIGILSSNVGNKKRIEIAKKSIEMNVKFSNFNAKKFLDEIESKKAFKKTENVEKKEEKSKE